MVCWVIFFFKQKTAYEMRISDWSSDVCSSDLKPEEIIGKLREAEIVLARGGTTADACRRIAVTEQTYYRWRKEYGGLKTDQARRMKDLEKENLRLRRAISDLTLDKLILQDRKSAV